MTPAHKKFLGIFIVLISTVIFGIHPNTTRAVYADGGNAMLVMAAMTIARAFGLLFLAGVLKQGLFRHRDDIRTAVSGGFFQALSGFCMVFSLVFITGPVAVVIFHFSALLLLFFSIWRGEIKLSMLVVLSTFGALAGLTLVVDIWTAHQKLSLIGVGLAFLSAAATATRLYIYGHLTKQRNPSVVGAEAFIFATLFVLAALFFEGVKYPASLQGWLWLAAGCVASAMGTIGMFYGIALLGAFEYSLLSKLEPLFTALFAAVLLSEVLNFLQYLGTVIVMTSLFAYQYGTIRRSRLA